MSYFIQVEHLQSLNKAATSAQWGKPFNLIYCKPKENNKTENDESLSSALTEDLFYKNFLRTILSLEGFNKKSPYQSL